MSTTITVEFVPTRLSYALRCTTVYQGNRKVEVPIVSVYKTLLELLRDLSFYLMDHVKYRELDYAILLSFYRRALKTPYLT